jgi:hypothetical protein
LQRNEKALPSGGAFVFAVFFEGFNGITPCLSNSSVACRPNFKTTAMRRQLLAALLLLQGIAGFAQAGKDGAETIATTNVIFNRYAVLSATASAGANTITVGAIADLSAAAIAGAANNPYAATALAYGDMIMIIKMQGATMNTTNTSSYGAISSYNNTGVYELRLVRGVTGNTITLCNPLVNTFTVGGRERVQVVRIPRITTLTINSGASLTGNAWNGTTGGVVAVEANGAITVNGTITATGLGFRGGALENNSTLPGNTNFISTLATDGAEKGESIIGNGTDYDALGGRYNRGAPANGGGGGNAHNAGGGGGANGGVVASWTGNGNPASGFSSAWDLEGASFSTSTSSGGGRGGYTYGSTDQNALTTGPGNTAWSGDNRLNAGGIGGRPMAYSVNTLFLGGGGGAGDANNNVGTGGGNGGGIVFLLGTSTLSGTGSIVSNGIAAANTTAGNNDAPGGGGGGGAIRLNISGAISGIVVNATGGAGGSQGAITGESEGPGGGGGGGFVSVTGTPGITISVAGGANGTTSSTALTEFPPNGATRGGAGSSLNNQTFVAGPALTCFALPATLVRFSVTRSGQQPLINWTTELETELLVYIIEVSEDGNTWLAVANQQPRNVSGRSEYAVTLQGTVSGSYFRLKMVDRDGSFRYSEIKQLTARQTSINAYVNGNRLVVEGLPSGSREAQVYLSNGQLVRRSSGLSQPRVQLEIASLKPGIYLLVIEAGGSTEKIRFRKN